MSVIMTLWFKADPEKLEAVYAADPDLMRGITDRARQEGCIGHRFYASDDGQIMAIDEWPDPESFQRFYEAASAEIGPLMREAGVTMEPAVTFWRKLDTGDEIGWGAED